MCARSFGCVEMSSVNRQRFGDRAAAHARELQHNVNGKLN